ncbi:glycosyltransferase [Runella zeae]|uniref:glycosyltransferase n=1 Tax=Runella zeae TaxID=94255 RepID=UPI002357C466|nr:glycosyltransferase [Runella zeae]
MQLPERTLIYDRDISGHHLDYLQFLVEYLKQSPPTTREKFVFVLHEGAKVRFQKDESMINFYYIKPEDLDFILSHAGVIARAAAEMNYLKSLVERYHTQRLVFMHIDAFQYELGKAFIPKLGIKIAGLLFLPFRKYYEDGSTLKAKLKREWRGWRKGLQMKWMLRHPQIDQIFILNDKQGVQEYNRKFGSRFEYLPDPIDVGLPITTATQVLKDKYGIPSEKMIFLIYGHLSERKNVPNILEALTSLSTTQHQQMCILICGEPEIGYETALYSAIEKAEKKYPDVSFVKHIRFFNPNDTNEAIKLADVVLVPYINFFSSSNILGLAAKYSKPMIASKLGVMGALVHQYKLGLTVAPQKPAAIAEAIKYYLNHLSATIDGQKYLEDHTAEVFCKKILLL